MIDHCEFPYGDDAVGWQFGGPGVLTLALVFLLGVVVGGLLINMLRAPRRPRRESSVDEIWRTVHRAIVQVDSMPDDRILAGLNHLIFTLEQSLGGVMKLGGEAQARLRALRDAVEGKPPPGSPTHPHPGHGPEAAPRHHSAPAHQAPVQIEQNVGSPHVDVTIIEAPGHGGSHGEHHGHGRSRDLRQMLADARVAVGVFSNYWSSESARVADLSAAHDDLVRRPRSA
jgi:hypothetical protein